MSGTNGKVLILGLGGAGGKVVSRIASQRIAGLDTVAIDTDIAALEALDSNVQKLNAGSEWGWNRGTGCGGDIIRGEQAISNERHNIMELIDRRSFIIVVAGLGGGVSSGGIRTITSTIRAKKIPSVFLLTTPFSFESFAKRKAAEDSIDQLLPVTDILIRLPNDLLFSMISPECSVDQAFAKSCDEIARTVIGLCGLLNCKNSLNVDYAGFMAMFRGKRCQCSCGIGTGFQTEETPDRTVHAIKQMLESPFLGGADKIASADALIVSVCAGPDLQLGEMKRTLETVSAMAGKQTDVISGFSTASFMGSAFQVAVITVNYDPEEKETVQKPRKEEKASPLKRTVRKKKAVSDLEQGMLELTNYSKGLFINTVPVIFHDEDLDIPTFQRRGIQIDKGRNSR